MAELKRIWQLDMYAEILLCVAQSLMMFYFQVYETEMLARPKSFILTTYVHFEARWFSFFSELLHTDKYWIEPMFLSYK